MAEYTPTTEEVREALEDRMWAQRTWRPEFRSLDGAEMDRWLAEHDAAVEAAVRADQITKDAAIAKEQRPWNYDRPDDWTENAAGVAQAADQAATAILAQLSVPVTPGGNK